MDFPSQNLHTLLHRPWTRWRKSLHPEWFLTRRVRKAAASARVSTVMLDAVDELLSPIYRYVDNLSNWPRMRWISNESACTSVATRVSCSFNIVILSRDRIGVQDIHVYFVLSTSYAGRNICLAAYVRFPDKNDTFPNISATVYNPMHVAIFRARNFMRYKRSVKALIDRCPRHVKDSKARDRCDLLHIQSGATSLHTVI